MDWGDTPAWVALTVSLVAAVLSWRSLRWERLSAEAAQRSAEIAERAERRAERAMEDRFARDAAARDGGGVEILPGEPSSGGSPTVGGPPSPTQAPEPVADVRWRIERPEKQRYVLRNVGTAVAEHVKVDPAQVPIIHRHLPSDAVIRPGEGVDMLLMGAFGHPMPNQLYLRWEGQADWIAVPLPS